MGIGNITFRSVAARGRWFLLTCLLVLSTQYWVLGTPDDLPDPLPLRRVLLPPERVPEEMKRLGQGLLKQLPRDDFEDLVQRAARAAEAAKKQPRLVESHYRARLVSSDLTGTGSWKVLNPAAGTAVLPLAGLNLALRQPRFENQAALVADLDGRGPGLLLEHGGEHTAAFDWSARGERRPEGLTFALEVPPAPIAALELQVPADAAVTVASDGCLLSGPAPAETADQRLWTINFAGRGQVRLIVRKTDGGGQHPLILAEQTTSQRVNPDAVEADFRFALQVLHGSAQELRCECDPALRPYRVLFSRPAEDTPRPIETWQVVPGPGSSPPTLAIHLPEPVQGGTLEVQALAPLAVTGGSAAWTCPGMRLLGAVPRGETLELRLNPNVSPEQWQSGGFRLTQSRTAADGSLVLGLVGGGLASGPAAPRPGARLRTSGVDYRVQQLTWWQVAPPPGEAGPAPAGPSALTVQLTYDVLRGHLFQLPVALPPGWEVDRLQLNPPDLLRGRSVRTEGGRSVLLVDLQRAVSSGTPAKTDASRPQAAPLRLTVWLRPTAGRGPARAPGGAAGLVYPFPDVVPLGARLREGALAIDYDESAYDARPTTAAQTSTPDEEGPWGKQVPDYYYPYRGQPVQGTLVLLPRRPRVRARCTSAVGLTAERAALETHLTLQPEVGTPDSVDVYVSAPPGKWEWKTEEGTNAVRSFERLPAAEAMAWLLALGAARPPEAAGLLGALARLPAWSRGERWRLTLERPLREPVTLAGTWELQRAGGPGEPRVDVPLLSVLGAARMEGEVKLYLAGANLVQVEAAGLRELQTPAGPRGNAPPPWRVFHYTQPPLALTLRGQGVAADLSPRPVIDHARLTTYAGADGPLLLHYRFEVANWPQQALPLQLPAGARLLRARVDGRWLAQLAPAAPAGGPVPVDLPVPVGGARHHYEVVYSLQQPVWTLTTRLEAPEPGLPLELRPRAFRRTWRLAPGVAPLLGGQDRLPGPARAPDTPTAWGQYVGTLWERWGPGEWLRRLALSHSSPDDWQAEQRERLAQAAAGLGKTGSLGEALRRLVFDQVPDQEVLVLDVEALREAGLGPTTPLPAPEGGRPFWEGVGLVHLPCQAAPLLTTRRQAEAWQYAARQGTTLSPSLMQAVAEAVLFGHDRSGRFATVIDWLDDAGQAAGPSPAQPLVPEPVGRGWTAWEPVAGTPGDDALRVVRQDALPWWGGTLAGLLGLAFWRARKRTRGRRLVLLLAWLSGAGLALLWLPTSLQALAWWPLLAGFVVAAGWYLRAAVRARPGGPSTLTSRTSSGSGRRTPSSLVTGSASILFLAALTAAWGLLPTASFRAAPPEPVTVFLVPGPADAPEEQSVLVPPDLLGQLQALAQRGSPALRGAVLVSAEYRGEVKKESDDTAAFEATLGVHVFGDEAATVALPLAGVQLEEVLVDGARTAPLPAATGYNVAVKGKGDHVLTLRFRVSVTSAGPDRDLQFTLPRLPQSRLTLTVPEGARYLQALVKQGATTHEPRDRRLEVGLGQVAAPVHFRWRQEAGPAPVPVLKVQELYLWDLGASESSLSAVLQYTVQQGAVTSLAVELPAGLEVRNAEVAALGNDEPRPRLRDQQVAELTPGKPDGPRRLKLDFQGPVTTGVQVLLDLVPARPPGGAREVLPLPTPLGAEPTTGYLAYRLDRLTGELKTYLRVRPIDPPEFARRWKDARGTAPAPVTYACVFGRKPGAPALGLELAVQPPRFEAVQDLAWRLGPRQADLRATLRLTAPDGDLALVEWDVPDHVTVARVTGPDVRHWGRSGSRVQAWLQRSVSATELQLVGWWQPPGGGSDPKKPPAAETPFAFDLPRLGVPATRAQTTYVRLTAAGGLALARVRSHGLVPLPDLRPSEQEAEYVARTPDYGGSFRVRPAAAATDVQVLTLTEVRDRQLTFTAVVDCRPRQGELRTLELRLRNWDGDRVTLQEAAEVVQAREHPREGGDRTWTVDLHPGVTGRCRLTLTGSLPLEEAAAGVPMPDVTVPGATRSERWLGVAGPELTAQEARGLAAVKNPANVLRPWPEAARRLRGGGSGVWKVAAADDDWGLRLLPRDRAGGPVPVQVFLTELTARVPDGRHWVHESTCWLYHEGTSDLSVTLPEGAAVLGATVDGADVTPLQPDPRSASLWLPLPGGTGARRVCLRWAFREVETLDRPNLERPRLGGVADGPVMWTVDVPAGHGFGDVVNGAVRPASRAGMELRRAEAQLRLSAALAQKAHGRGDAFAGQLAAAQRRFYQALRNAEHWLATAAARPGLLKSAALWGEADQALASRAVVADVGAEGQGLGDWLQQLEEKNAELAKASPDLEALRAEAKRRARAGGPPTSEGTEAEASPVMGRPAGPGEEGGPGRGTPLYWQASDPATPSPAVHLTAVQTQQTRRAVGASLLLAALLLAAWVLSWFPGVLPWLRGLWPEQALLLGGLAWLVFGLSVLGGFLVLLGVLGRLMYLARRAWAWLWRETPVAGSNVAPT
jgi:hypothetical protein